MEMIGYWLTPTQYRIKHPVSGRTQDILFEREREDLDLIIKYRKKLAETELAEPKRARVGTPVARRYNTARTLVALRSYEEWKTGRWELPTVKEAWNMPGTKGL